MSLIQKITSVAVLVVLGITVSAQSKPVSIGMADTAMTRLWAESPNGTGIPPKWVYDYGVILNGM
jgi:hypothetical protein